MCLVKVLTMERPIRTMVADNKVLSEEVKIEK